MTSRAGTKSSSKILISISPKTSTIIRGCRFARSRWKTRADTLSSSFSGFRSGIESLALIGRLRHLAAPQGEPRLPTNSERSFTHGPSILPSCISHPRDSLFHRRFRPRSISQARSAPAVGTNAGIHHRRGDMDVCGYLSRWQDFGIRPVGPSLYPADHRGGGKADYLRL